MSENLNAYDATGNIIKLEERKKLLAEIQAYSRETGDVNYAVATIYVILATTNGDLFVVKRGDKPENPNMYDKTAGGHVVAGDSYIETLHKECQEEIGTSIVLAESHEDYHEKLNTTDLTKQAVVRQIDFQPWMKSVRAIKDGTPWIKRHRVMIFAGVYDGPVEFVDGEAIGLQLLSKEKLLKEMDENPENFTYDLGVLLQGYSAMF